MLRWAAVPVVVFALTFAGSLAYFVIDDGDDSSGTPAPTPGGRLVVTYTPAVDDADHGYLASLRLDGSDLQNVIEPPGSGAASNGSPSVAPGGRRVAFQRAVAGPGSPARRTST